MRSQVTANASGASSTKSNVFGSQRFVGEVSEDATDGTGKGCNGSKPSICQFRRLRILIPRIDFALDSRQEPYEVILHVRICAGGRRQRRSLPRPGIVMSMATKAQ